MRSPLDDHTARRKLGILTLNANLVAHSIERGINISRSPKLL